MTRSEVVPEGAGALREEDAFDVAAVAGWLAEHADERVRAELVGVPEVRQFSGGASNLTFLLRYPTRDLILRRPPRGTKARGAHDMGREHRIQRSLAPVFPYVAPMLGHCTDEAVIGAEFYVMERVDGWVPRADLSPEALTPDDARRMCENVVDVLVQLHSVDPAEAGLEALGKGDGYVRRQVEGWSTRYRNARTDDAPGFEQVMAWLAEHQPEDVRTCVIHNDFKVDNIVFDHEERSKVVAVLDWEMATLGDPLMDLGGALAFWVEPEDEDMEPYRRVPTQLPGMMTRAEVVARYSAGMGLTVTPEQWRFYEVFGIFRLAVIAQQIYYRWFHGQTTNEVYALFGPVVHVAEARARRLLGT